MTDKPSPADDIERDRQAKDREPEGQEAHPAPAQNSQVRQNIAKGGVDDAAAK